MTRIRVITIFNALLGGQDGHYRGPSPLNPRALSYAHKATERNAEVNNMHSILAQQTCDHAECVLSAEAYQERYAMQPCCDSEECDFVVLIECRNKKGELS